MGKENFADQVTGSSAIAFILDRRRIEDEGGFTTDP